MVGEVVLAVLKEHHALVEFVFDGLVVLVSAVRVTDYPSALPGANHKRQGREFNTQIVWENEQLLLALKKLVENQDGDSRNGKAGKH